MLALGSQRTFMIVCVLVLSAARVALGQALPVPAPVPGDSFRKPQFIRGDTNSDGQVDIGDAVFELFHLFSGTVQIGCLATGDTNADRELDASDAVFILAYLFLGKAPPPAPGPRECGVDPDERWLPCERYDICGNDRLLIHHVLNRITFGPTQALLSRIQTRDDLSEYIEEQLNPPAIYDPAVHEPGLVAEIDSLDIGFRENYQSVNRQNDRLESMLILNGAKSEWQLLHVLTEFWNNHFHTQHETLRQNFFKRGVRGGVDGRNRASREMFDAVNTNGNAVISEAEWNAFRGLHPSVMPYSLFPKNAREDGGGVDLDEFLARRNIAYWKYGRGREQNGVAADMEKREYDALRRRAFGKFRDLLEASAKGVAMLIYLNTFENTVAAANENYGREFFELSSLGVDWIYTQKDIEEVSKVFTGWTVDWVRRSHFSVGDDNFQNNPAARAFTLSGPRTFWDCGQHNRKERVLERCLK